MIWDEVRLSQRRGAMKVLRAGLAGVLCLLGSYAVHLAARDFAARASPNLSEFASLRSGTSNRSHSLKYRGLSAERRLIHSRLQAGFEPNLGQARGDARFLTSGKGYTVFLTYTGAVIHLYRGIPESIVNEHGK